MIELKKNFSSNMAILIATKNMPAASV